MLDTQKQDFPHIVRILLLTVLYLTSAPSFSQSLDEAVSIQLAIEPGGLGCAVLFAAGGNPTGALLDICNRPVAAGLEPGSTGGASATPGTLPTASAADKAAKDKERANQLRISNKWTLFFTAESGSIDRKQTPFEGPFDSTFTRFLGGASYAPNDKLVINGFVDISSQEGDFENGGTFNDDATGLNILTAYQVNDKTSAQISVFFQNMSTDRTRIASFSDFLADGTPYNFFEGTPTASYDPTKIGLAANVDYEFVYNNITLTPQAGFEWFKQDFGSFSERDDSGLQLRFHNDKFESFQSKIGVTATYVINTSKGVFIPQVNLDWRHEFEQEGRNVIVSFVEDLNSTKFSYETNGQDGNYFDLNIGGVYIFPHGYQGFFNVASLLGHDHFDSTIFSAGIRKEL